MFRFCIYCLKCLIHKLIRGSQTYNNHILCGKYDIKIKLRVDPSFISNSVYEVDTSYIEGYRYIIVNNNEYVLKSIKAFSKLGLYIGLWIYKLEDTIIDPNRAPRYKTGVSTGCLPNVDNKKWRVG